MTYCAIDFGTSNSAVAVPRDGMMHLALVEGVHRTLPTAVFFNADEQVRAFGRAALAAYIDGFNGRLMRSIKSILGSALADGTTAIGDGSAIRYTDVVALLLRHLRQRAQIDAGATIDRVVLGRPVFFVDDDPKADALAQRQLADAARSAGFGEIEFQYEPIAAAFDYEARLEREQLVLVADLGGGTSDFSLVRVGPSRKSLRNRKEDVLAHYGVHVAGTDFDRRVTLSKIMPELGYRSLDTERREIPSRIYFDLATWHLVNTLYTPRRITELRLTRHLYSNSAHHARLMRVIEHQLGHGLLAHAEQAKIAVSAGGDALISLDAIETKLSVGFDTQQLIQASREETARIVAAAQTTARLAGVGPADISAVYFTGGSSGLQFLAHAIVASFPNASALFGDRLASVASGLGIYARRLFEATV
jgi:hypothetical chaperone protein